MPHLGEEKINNLEQYCKGRALQDINEQRFSSCDLELDMWTRFRIVNKIRKRNINNMFSIIYFG